MKSIYLILCLCLLSCGPTEEESQNKFTVGFKPYLSAYIGHEDLSYFAMKQANKLLGQTFYKLSGHQPGKTVGIKSKHPLIRGAYLADRPMDAGDGEIKLAEVIGRPIASNGSWHDMPESQSFHFLRVNQPLQTAKSACESSQQRIRQLSQKGLSLYKKRATLGLNYFGVASHIIQDSYSTAHAVRKGAEVHDVCSFGEKNPNHCFHSHLDAATKDLIYKSAVVLPIGVEASIENLKDEAKQAVTATASYLALMAKGTKGSAVNLESFFQTYIRCVGHKPDKHGEAVLELAGVGSYAGELRDGKPHGFGVMSYLDGSMYRGQWQDGLRSGEGVFTYPKSHDRAEYQGQWQEDQAHGEGRILWKSGSIYEGGLKHGLRHGAAILWVHNGNRYAGSYQEDRREGAFTVHLANGDVWQYVYAKGQRVDHKKISPNRRRS